MTFIITGKAKSSDKTVNFFKVPGYDLIEF